MRRKWRMTKSQKRELDGLFYQCSFCKTEHATWHRRTKHATFAVCSICGHEKMIARYRAGEEFADNLKARRAILEAAE